MKKLARECGGFLLLALLFGFTGCGSYNRLVTLEQNVNKKWADVQSVYQRRADLIPNLVNTVAGRGELREIDADRSDERARQRRPGEARPEQGANRCG